MFTPSCVHSQKCLLLSGRQRQHWQAGFVLTTSRSQSALSSRAKATDEVMHCHKVLHVFNTALKTPLAMQEDTMIAESLAVSELDPKLWTLPADCVCTEAAPVTCRKAGRAESS